MRGMVWLFVVGCGRPAAEPETPAEPPAAEQAATPAEDAAPARRVFFVSPADGATVTSPVKLVFGVEGMEIRAAGDLTENTGHHHLIVSDAGIPAGTTVPKDEKHIHFGQGETEGEVVLEPGTHRLTMQFADGNHVSYGEPMAATITITVAP
jgi:hypothetical protein